MILYLSAKIILAFAPVAQLVEHLTFNQGVRSSILRRSTKGLRLQSLLYFQIRDVAQLVVARQKQLSVVFGEAKPPKARSRQSRRLAKAIGDDYATVAFSPLGRADILIESNNI